LFGWEYGWWFVVNLVSIWQEVVVAFFAVDEFALRNPTSFLWDDAVMLFLSLFETIVPAAPLDDDPTTTSSTSLNRSQTQSIASIHISTSETVDAFNVAKTCFRDDADTNDAKGDDGDADDADG
jgi:hypothetical protein